MLRQPKECWSRPPFFQHLISQVHKVTHRVSLEIQAETHHLVPASFSPFPYSYLLIPPGCIWCDKLSLQQSGSFCCKINSTLEGKAVSGFLHWLWIITLGQKTNPKSLKVICSSPTEQLLAAECRQRRFLPALWTEPLKLTPACQLAPVENTG